MALEEWIVVQDFKRVRWVDLEDEEQSSRYEQMAEKEEITNRSETLTQTHKDSDNETCVARRPATARENDAVCRRHDKDTRQAKDDDNDEIRHGDQQQQEEDRGEHEADELILTQNVKNRSSMALIVWM